MGRRGPKKNILVEQGGEDIIHHKWNINLKQFWLIHQQVLDEIESKTLSFSTADTFMDWWIAIIGIFSHASVQWSLPSTWPEPRHKEMRKEMKEQMEQVRMSVKDMKLTASITLSKNTIVRLLRIQMKIQQENLGQDTTPKD